MRQTREASEFPGLSRVERSGRFAERYRACRSVPQQPTLYHSSYYRLPAQRDTPSVVTVHDFAYERCVGGLATHLHRAQKNAAIRHAQAIICVSQSTRDDLLDLVGLRPGQQLHVVYNGVSEVFAPLPAGAPAQAGAPFALFVGQRGRYKNFGLALAALARLPGLELHCVGGGPLLATELAGADPQTRTRVRHLGTVSQAELNALYNGAECLIYPSSYEGFGIPVLEAMRAGCPVVSLACRGVLEVGAEALTVAEADGASLAHAVSRTRAPGYRSQVRAAGFARAALFSWERNFEQTMQVYRSLAG